MSNRRQEERFKSQHHAQRFLACHELVNNLLRLGRNLIKQRITELCVSDRLLNGKE